ncbi:MAG: alpha/beta hydrolase [Bacteroidota bacterium]
MRKRLIIISDLWGWEKSDWLIYYTQGLEKKFDITLYDSCQIGKVDTSDYAQDYLHKQFVHSGIDLAVDHLVEKEKHPVNILAFSVGGVIAWKYGLRTGNLLSLYCISSTRLRKEVKKPKGEIKLFFGANDPYKPPLKWLEGRKLKATIIPNKGHEVYREAEFANNLSDFILSAHVTHSC